MITLTSETMKLALPACHDPTYWASILPAIGAEFGIDTRIRFAMWLAQCAHESNQLNAATGRENMSYSAAGLVATFHKYFPTLEAAALYARQPEKIACVVYANRLGNGPVESNDGWTYRGGGMIQLTGRANYVAAGKALGLNLVGFPRLIEQPKNSARVAGWFWKTHGCNELADAGDFEKITETINGPRKLGLAERTAYLNKLLEVMPT